MKQFLIYTAFLLLDSVLLAQNRNSFNFVIGAGASYFFNDPALRRQIDNTRLVGVNYIFTTKDQNLGFNPGLNVQTSGYHSRINETRTARVAQTSLGLNLDMLLKISKKMILRVGLLFNGVISSNIVISESYYKGRSTYFYGNSEMHRGYNPANLQAGFTAGLSFPFKLFRRDHKFNIKFVEIVSPLVTSDYILTKDFVGEDVTILSVKARPTMFILGFDFNFKRLKKKKTEEED